MITVIEPYNFDKYSDILNQMFKLRAHVFGEKLGWQVSITDGLERDRYDDLRPAYVVLTDDTQTELYGSLRLMPTVGPTLLFDVFGDTLPDAASLVAPNIWECTRFCMDERKLAGRRDSLDAMRASSMMLLGLCEIGLKSGIDTVVGNFDPLMLRIYRKSGCEVDVLGKSERFGERPVYLGAFEVSQRILLQMRAKLGINYSLLVPRHEQEFGNVA